jgi:hypothetical protein
MATPEARAAAIEAVQEEFDERGLGDASLIVDVILDAASEVTRRDEASGANYVGPGRYRHYKGGEYEVLGLAMHESMLYRLVIYRPLTAGSKLDGTPVTFWARPLDDFNEQVPQPGVKLDFTKGQVEHGYVMPRFEKMAGGLTL